MADADIPAFTCVIDPVGAVANVIALEACVLLKCNTRPVLFEEGVGNVTAPPAMITK